MKSNLLTKTDYDKIAREINQKFTKAHTERTKMVAEMGDLQSAMEKMTKMFGQKAETRDVESINQSLKSFATFEDLKSLYKKVAPTLKTSEE